MYICNCKGVTEQDIRKAVSDGATNLRSIRKCTGASEQCGKCAPHVETILNETLEDLNCYDVMGSNYA